MKIALVLFGIFTLTTCLLIFVYEKPNKKRPKLTGRGGDFES